MKKKLIAAFAVVAAVGFGAPASATTVTVSAAGVMNNSFGDPQATFDGLTAEASGSTTAFGPFTDNGANFTGLGMIENGTSANLYAAPLGDTSNYLTVMPAGSPETIALNATYFHFGLYWGSMDTYNTIAFYENGTLLDSLTGAQIAALVPASATGDQTGNENNRYVEFTLIGDNSGFNSVVLSSSENSFEVDNLSWGPAQEIGPSPTPLPGALPLFVSGLGGLGFMRFWRKKRAVKVAVA